MRKITLAIGLIMALPAIAQTNTEALESRIQDAFEPNLLENFGHKIDASTKLKRFGCHSDGTCYLPKLKDLVELEQEFLSKVPERRKIFEEALTTFGKGKKSMEALIAEYSAQPESQALANLYKKSIDDAVLNQRIEGAVRNRFEAHSLHGLMPKLRAQAYVRELFSAESPVLEELQKLKAIIALPPEEAEKKYFQETKGNGKAYMTFNALAVAQYLPLVIMKEYPTLPVALNDLLTFDESCTEEARAKFPNFRILIRSSQIDPVKNKELIENWVFRKGKTLSVNCVRLKGSLRTVENLAPTYDEATHSLDYKWFKTSEVNFYWWEDSALGPRVDVGYASSHADGILKVLGR